MSKPLLILPTRLPLSLLAKAHVAGYTRKDGVFVKEHNDHRQAAEREFSSHGIGQGISALHHAAFKAHKLAESGEGSATKAHMASHTAHLEHAYAYRDMANRMSNDPQPSADAVKYYNDQADEHEKIAKKHLDAFPAAKASGQTDKSLGGAGAHIKHAQTADRHFSDNGIGSNVSRMHHEAFAAHRSADGGGNMVAAHLRSNAAHDAHAHAFRTKANYFQNSGASALSDHYSKMADQHDSMAKKHLDMASSQAKAAKAAKNAG